MEHQKLPTSQELNVIWRGLDPDLPDFRFEWSAKRTRTAGTIWHESRLIRLSVRHYLEFGMEEIKDTLKHEAAHHLAWLKSQRVGHTQLFYYYLGMFRAKRHCPSLSSDMKSRRVRVKNVKPKRLVEYDPVSKTFRQSYQ